MKNLRERIVWGSLLVLLGGIPAVAGAGRRTGDNSRSFRKDYPIQNQVPTVNNVTTVRFVERIDQDHRAVAGNGPAFRGHRGERRGEEGGEEHEHHWNNRQLGPYFTPYYDYSPFWYYSYPYYYESTYYEIGYRNGLNAGLSDSARGFPYDPYRYDWYGNASYLSGFLAGYRAGYYSRY
jgi:hypothetical protein